MSNEKSLIIVEAAQSPQVVAVSDVSSDEIEYQRLHRECAAIFDQLGPVARQYVATLERIAHAWFAENYPGLSYDTKPYYKGGNTLQFGIELNIEASVGYARVSAIDKEFREYLRHLTA